MPSLSGSLNGAAGSAGGRAAPALQSPSLFGPDTTELDGPPAYELKFLLHEEQAGEVVARVARRLAPDPYGDPALGGAYRTTSVYTDTPQFDVFHRAGNSA